MRTTRGAEAYRRMEAESRSPMELVVMLYDGAIRFAAEARDAIARNDVRARTDASQRALEDRANDVPFPLLHQFVH